MARKKTTVPEADTRERILAAARDVFARIGYAAARVDDIAARAGINKAMLYYHVGDKERLYTTVLVETVESSLASLREATEKAKTPAEKLQCVFETLAEFGDSNPQFVPIMMREIASGGATLPDEMVLRMSGVFRIVADVLAEGVAKGAFRKTDPLLTHVSLVGSMLFLVASQPIRARVSKMVGVPHVHSLHDLAAHAGNLFLHGLDVESRPPKKKKARKKK